MARKNYTVIFILAFSTLIHSALSAGSPWVLEQGESTYSAIYVSEDFNKAWIGPNKVDKPGGDVQQQTLWLSYERGISDKLQLGVTTGTTSSTFDARDGHETEDFSGLADSRISVKYNLLNEYLEDSFSLAVNVAAIIKGSYGRSYDGSPHSPGDKANGVELGFPVGKHLFGLNFMGELGYRHLTDEVPAELFWGVGVGKSISNKISISTKYSVTDSQGDLDIAGEGFTPNRFHETEEDKELVELNTYFSLTPTWSLFAGGARVLDGRNTGDSRILYIGFTFSP